MPFSRHREQDQTMGISGTYQTFSPFPSLTVQTATVGVTRVCDDQVCVYREKRLPQSLLLVTKDTQLPVFSGVYPIVGTPTKQLSGCPADYKPAPPNPSTKFPPLTTIQQSSLAWESLAATNPNVAHVSLPTYWAELKDLPLLWRTWGDKQLSHAARLWKEVRRSSDPSDKGVVRLADRYAKSIDFSSRSAMLSSVNKLLGTHGQFEDLLTLGPKAHIWYRWGWAPLVSDIRKMFSFTDAVMRRIKWISHLQTGKRVLKRRATLRNATDQDTPTTVQLKSVGANIQGRRTVVYTEKVWTAVQWKLDPSFSVSGVGLVGDPLWVLAHQLTFGLTTQDALSALWEIMPWSWFADWFLHIQTVMDATKNTIPVTWGSISLMRHTNATALVTPLTSSADLSWCRPSGVHRQSEDRKQRLIVSPILPFAPSMMPVFTTGQWSILGSLAVLKSVGR